MSQWINGDTRPKHSGTYLVYLDYGAFCLARYSTHYREWSEESPGLEVSWRIKRDEIKSWMSLPGPPA